MDEHYDFEKAGIRLQELMEEISSNCTQAAEATQLASCKVESYMISEYDEPKSWRLSHVTEEGIEPLSLRIQGILSGLNLPPIHRASSSAAMDHMRPYIRQSVSLAGMGAQSFGAAVEKMDEVHMLFLNHLPPGALNESSPSYYRDGPVFAAHNRYFTAARLVPNQPQVPFDCRVDPEGHLQAMVTDAFVHIEDNEVQYFGLQTGDSKGSFGGPAAFRVGDIVEITVEFCAFPAANKKYTLLTILRGIRMLCPDFRNTAAILAMKARRSVPLNTLIQVPKRKAMYTNEELEKTREQFQKLRMDTTG